jgi:hypothetical protein
MNDFYKFKHEIEGTHFACAEIANSDGPTTCCGCTGHICFQTEGDITRKSQSTPKEDWDSPREKRIRKLMACVRKITTLSDIYKEETLWRMISEELDGYIQSQKQELLERVDKEVLGPSEMTPNIDESDEYVAQDQYSHVARRNQLRSEQRKALEALKEDL